MNASLRFVSVFGLLAAVLAAPSTAAEPPLPRPSPPPGTARGGAPAREGWGVVRGMVTSAQSGAPLRRARATGSSPALTSARSAATDDIGQHRIAGLPPGFGDFCPGWTFALPGAGGAFMVQVRPLPAGWTVKQVLHEGADVSDTALRARAARVLLGEGEHRALALPPTVPRQ